MQVNSLKEYNNHFKGKTYFYIILRLKLKRYQKYREKMDRNVKYVTREEKDQLVKN